MDTDAHFFPALRQELGLSGHSGDWTQYAEPTSEGVFDEIIRKHHGRPMRPDEKQRVQTRLEQLMRAALFGETGRIVPTAGAPELLRQLKADPSWRLAIATGNWLKEGTVKLESAGLDALDLPIATSDDVRERRRILPLAVDRAKERYKVSDFSRVVYVGDGVWDVASARANGINFLGVGPESRIARLSAAGARSSVKDFADLPAVLTALRTCEVPAN